MIRALPYARDDKDEAEEKWIKWVDDHLVHILPANIYRTPRESLQSFEYISQESNFTTTSKFMATYSGALIMYLLTQFKLKKKYGIPDGQERETLYAAVDEWLAGVGDHAFQGGAAPNAADLSVFGVLRSLEGYDTFADLLDNTHVGGWYKRMEQQVGAPARVNPK